MTNAQDPEGRFEFGDNWSRFARELPAGRRDAARASLSAMLGRESLDGRTFLDIGSGSGLFSLAAVELGASRVHSLDFDPASVATTADVKRRFVPESSVWTIEQASVLDTDHMDALGRWDVVYSWGVLHHTGAMWEAMDVACQRVAPGGRLFISIYNDQGPLSKLWTWVKWMYNRLPEGLRVPYAVLAVVPLELRRLFFDTLKGRPQDWFAAWRQIDSGGRGMSRWYDLIDWVGGYPFEVARPDEVFAFCSSRGFVLRGLVTAGGGHGCNEFVFDLPAPGD
jgi:2-polyprenyl-6-hydroxyphenyl methylase/3-demethylubiquinone-9 3-methyltransferase